MTFFVGRIIGPEISAEERLAKRVQFHLSWLEETLKSGFELAELRQKETEIGDVMGELSFNLRRLVEVRKDKSDASGRMVGIKNGKKSVSLWDFICVGQHLLGFHMLSGKSGKFDDSSLMVIHSDSKSIGVYLADFAGVCRSVIDKPPKPHFGLFSDDMHSKTLDDEGRPTFNFIISSRRRALVLEHFFWTPLGVISPGLVSMNPNIDSEWLIKESPALKKDPIFMEVSDSAICV